MAFKLSDQLELLNVIFKVWVNMINRYCLQFGDILWLEYLLNIHSWLGRISNVLALVVLIGHSEFYLSGECQSTVGG